MQRCQGLSQLLEELRFIRDDGRITVAPIGFFLCGAESVITVDLHRRVEWDLTMDSLKWIAGHRDQVFGVYRSVVDNGVFDKRFAILSHGQHDPALFFKKAGIQYLAAAPLIVESWRKGGPQTAKSGH